MYKFYLERDCKTIILVLLLISLPLLAIAEPVYDDHGDMIPPGAEENAGTIDSIENQGFIINDSFYSRNEEVLYRGAGGILTSFDSFKVGDKIGFFAINRKITKIWLIEEDATEDQAQPEASGSVRKVDGVWVN